MPTLPVLTAALAAALLLCAPAQASEILVLGDDGRARVHEDRFLPAPSPMEPRAPAQAAERGGRGEARAAGKRRTVRGELRRLQRAGRITADEHDRYRRIYDRARSSHRRLDGARERALGAVLDTVEGLAARGRLAGSRAPALFLTLRRNREWWTRGPLLAGGKRVRFKDSRLIWQHYAGEGIQIQWLGTFGKANAFFSTREHDEELRQLLDEAVPLATSRGGGIAWEYLFAFGTGRPPWVSALAQGTGIQVLSRAAVRLGDSGYFKAARAALGIFERRAPTGIRVGSPQRPHYLIYSYDRDLRVLNGFVQALNGLYDFAKFANDDEGRRLFLRGERRLREELRRYDTGGWSRYSNRRDSDVGYHKLVRDFLRGLCTRLREGRLPPSPDPYCAMADRFTADLTTPPQLRLRSRGASAGRPKRVSFTLDKPATVTMTVARGGDVVERVTAHLASGRRTLTWDEPRRSGTYRVRLVATDLVGNRGSTAGELRVKKRG